MSNEELEAKDIMTVYREKIIEMIKRMECLDYLEFIYNMMMAFKEKWGM